MSLTSDQKKLWDVVDRILWEDWDPIGVNEEAPRDEYQSYVPQIVKMLLNKSSAEDIAIRLYKLETINIGLTGTSSAKDHCDVVARKLVDEALHYVK